MDPFASTSEDRNECAHSSLPQMQCHRAPSISNCPEHLLQLVGAARPQLRSYLELSVEIRSESVEPDGYSNEDDMTIVRLGERRG